MFHSWAFRRGLIAQLPFEYETVRAAISPDADLLAHLRTLEGSLALELTIGEYRMIPTALTADQLRGEVHGDRWVAEHRAASPASDLKQATLSVPLDERK